QDEARVRVVRRRTVDAHPHRVSRARSGRADVGVAVVRVGAPGPQDAVDIAVLARPADVVHDLVAPALDDRLPHPARDLVEDVVPGDLLPLALASLADAAHGHEDALRIADLVERGRT